MSQVSNLYLIIYNSLQGFGWFLALYKTLIDFAYTKSINNAYASSGKLICLLQTVAFMEVLHGALGIVASGVLIPLMQWSARIHYLTIIAQINEVQEHSSVFITFVAWSLGDIIRYSHHALNCLGSCPSWMTYIRYTVFIVLYPIGMAPGESWAMIKALPYIRKGNLYADVFSSLPFSYYDFVRVLLLAYPFLFLRPYLHLFKQRQRKLGKHHAKKKM